jgi:AraC-like DNA-binding protein
MPAVQRDVGVSYWELDGEFALRRRPTLGNDAVIFSNLHKFSASSPPARGLCVRYVARGRENYRIDGRGYRIEAGQVMIAPHELGAECEIQNGERSGTLGLCTLLFGATEATEWAFGPMVLGRECTPIGQVLHDSAERLWRGAHRKHDVARKLIHGLRSDLPLVAKAIVGQAAAVEAAKASTRYEMVRRANLAQAFLHASTDRPIELHELAAVVGVSSFRLLAAFQRCFGETPAAYHRKLRLKLALEQASRRRLPIAAVCDQFGFSGSSSFSHAYRRAFGRAPLWSKTRSP